MSLRRLKAGTRRILRRSSEMRDRPVTHQGRKILADEIRKARNTSGKHSGKMAHAYGHHKIVTSGGHGSDRPDKKYRVSLKHT